MLLFKKNKACTFATTLLSLPVHLATGKGESRVISISPLDSPVSGRLWAAGVRGGAGNPVGDVHIPF